MFVCFLIVGSSCSELRSYRTIHADRYGETALAIIRSNIRVYVQLQPTRGTPLRRLRSDNYSEA